MLALMALAPTGAGAAEMGLTTNISAGESPPQMDRDIAMLKDLHTRWTRVDLRWNAFERDAKGVHTNASYLAAIQYGVAQARAAGIQVDMALGGVPYWASSDPSKFQDASGDHYDPGYPPANFQDFADFAAWAANQFKSLGVHVYEVWNEPNLPYFWPAGPDAATYTQMLKASYPAIHQADPFATVLMGGLFTSDYDFLQAMYDAGAKPYFDAANVHPYSGPVGPNGCFHNHLGPRKPKTAFCGITEIRKTMVANGDGAKPVWLTELGYSTDGGASGMGVSYAQQAGYLTVAYRIVQGYSWVKAMIWYELQDSSESNSWNSNLGLITAAPTRKPAYAAYKAYAIATNGGLHAPVVRHRRKRRRHPVKRHVKHHVKRHVKPKHH
jgi:polysaccharide biosynthesis protein PslG